MVFFVEELLASGINLVSKNRVEYYGKNYSLFIHNFDYEPKKKDCIHHKKHILTKLFVIHYLENSIFE